MRIPSYDDLAPSIPDVQPGDRFAALRGLLEQPGDARPAEAAPAAAGTPAQGRSLYAALYGEPGAVARLAVLAGGFSPRFERHGDRTVVLDVSGLERLFGTPAAIAADLSRAGAPRVAVAASQTAAMLLVRAHDGVTVALERPGTALRHVSLAILQEVLADAADRDATAGDRRRQAAGRERTFDVLRRWGLTTAGEFAALPAAALSARLGPAGLALQRLAQGLDPRPLVPDPGVPRFAGSLELEWPIEALEPLSFVLARLLDPLAAALERADRGAVALHLNLRLTDRTTHARTIGLPAAIRDPRVLRTLLLLDLESHPPAAAIDVVSLELDPAPGRVVQYSLLERAVPAPETLATLMARLGALVGEGRCGSAVLLDSHRPDAFAMGAFAINSQPPTPNSQSATPHPSFSPVGVGRWPLEVEGCSPLLRRFRPPVAVRVGVEGGRPVRVAVDRRGMPGGTVQQAAGPWRTSGGWWEPARWNRDEWDVAFGDGTVCRVFRDRDSGGWFLDGIFD